MSDIKFVLTGSDGTQVRVPAHKLVLAISSPVFEAMFYGELAEKREEIELPDTDANSLLEFLRFVYCDEVELTTENVLVVLYLAQKYFVPILVARCMSFLDENTNLHTACQILEVAKRFENAELEQRCWEMIDNQPSACLGSDRVLMLSRDTLVSLLKRETLWVEEIELFQAADRWAEAQCAHKWFEVTGANKREILGDALNLIRFTTMSRDEFKLHVEPSKILTSAETDEVYQNIDRCLPATAVKFPCTMRGCFRTAVFSCARHSGTTCGFQSEGKTAEETLTFETNEDIKLSGVCLFGEGRWVADVKVINEAGKILTTAQRLNQHGYTPGVKRAFNVMFERPARVSASSRYVITAFLRQVDGDNARESCGESLAAVTCAGVRFTFTGDLCARLIIELLFSVREQNSNCQTRKL